MAKLCRQYKFKFYLNMNHFIMNGDKRGEVHPHTWELSVSVVSDRKESQPFRNIEREVEAVMERYQDKLLNDCEPFDRIVPTVENAAHYFFQLIQESVVRHGWILLMLELSETPTRSYVINGLFDEDSIWSEWYENETERNRERLGE